MDRKNVNPKKVESLSKLKYQKPVKGKDQDQKALLPAQLIPPKYVSLVLVSLLFMIISLIYFPLAYQSRYPIAHDITQWEGGAKQIIEYNKENPDRALWTQRMFSGMPSYMISFPNRFPYLESVTKLTDKVINWRIFLLFIGGLGIFVLLRHLRMEPWIALFGAVAFVFSCHWVGLVEIGHNTKFRAIMYIPWVMWAIMYLKNKPGILGLGLSASFLITQLRENHPQITYYLYLLIGMYWVWQLLEALKNKESKRFGIFTLLLVIAFALTALAVLNPYLSTLEYSHYTMRGGSAGLEKSYAQGWSFHPWEILGLIIPDFFGGITTEAVPGMPQGVGPYWGWMEFTQIYNYFGIIVFFFGFFALFGKHRRMAIFLWVSSFIFTLMSFGKFAPALSDLFLNYLPFFNKFRVPSMILTMVQFNAVILAALGIDTIIAKSEKQDTSFQKLLFRAFWISGAVFVAYLILAKSLFSALPLATARETEVFTNAGYQSLLEELRNFRLERLSKSGIISLLFLTISLGMAYLYSAKKMVKTLFVFALILLTFIDLWIYTGKYLKDLKPVQEHRDHFAMRDHDTFLKQDTSNYRIFPVEVGPAGDWAFHHQTVDGYSAAKLKRYDDFLRTNLHGQFKRYKGVMGQYRVAVPTPALDMLNTKYIISADSIPYAAVLGNIVPVFRSPSSGIRIYENRATLSPAWFVDSLKVITPVDSILPYMNTLDFEPARTALVESQISPIQPTINRSVTQTLSEIHKLSYDVQTDAPSFLVLSEVYYPAGWKALLDGKEIPIHPVNYILRGVEIPAGKHKLELIFAPESYTRSISLSAIGLAAAFICLVAGIFLCYRQSKNEPKE